MSQAEVARMAGFSDRWYWQMENGRHANYSTESLDGLAHALRLTPAERLTLYLLAIGRPPDPHEEPESDAESAAAPAFQSMLDAQLPHPAYLADRAWNILRCNQPMGEWFPWIADQPNIMRWGFLNPEARRQLVNWQEDWARSFLARMRIAAARYPTYEPLQHLLDDVLAVNEEAREMWEQGEAVEHPDGSIRRLCLPFHGHQEVAVRILGLVPMRNPRLHLIVLMREGE
ncbi:helix-turn-helix domain-containing protein [Streptomyces sp. B1866]|uniref:helix-turn-helix domain-containing protein n=1 Tax=Streptomyces sp. B1866 TaxID=3075431 RepID=UPI0034D95C8B